MRGRGDRIRIRTLIIKSHAAKENKLKSILLITILQELKLLIGR